jgi:hypothetical protein
MSQFCIIIKVMYQLFGTHSKEAKNRVQKGTQLLFLVKKFVGYYLKVTFWSRLIKDRQKQLILLISPDDYLLSFISVTALKLQIIIQTQNILVRCFR